MEWVNQKSSGGDAAARVILAPKSLPAYHPTASTMTARFGNRATKNWAPQVPTLGPGKVPFYMVAVLGQSRPIADGSEHDRDFNDLLLVSRVLAPDQLKALGWSVLLRHAVLVAVYSGETLHQRGKRHESHHSFPVCAQTQQGQVLRFDLSDMLCDRDICDQRRGTHPGRE
jgi:hypothetical protein